VVNLGSPSAPTPSAVRAYLSEFLADPRVVDLPRLKWWLIRHLFVLPFRPRRSAALYRSIWTDEGAPLVATTREIGRRLARELDDGAGSPAVSVAMRYGVPSIGEGLRELTSRGCERVLVLPLYPQYSTTTTLSVADTVHGVHGHGNSSPEIRMVESYHDNPAYINALQSSARLYWEEHGPCNRLMISFHGIPQRTAAAGDPYPRHCAATARALASHLGMAPGRWHMAYQSRFGREPWLRPALDERLERWGRQGIRRVDVICPGFAADCLETLEEVAFTNRRLFESAGGRDFRYIPALNDRWEHISALADIVDRHTADWLSHPRRGDA